MQRLKAEVAALKQAEGASTQAKSERIQVYFRDPKGYLSHKLMSKGVNGLLELDPSCKDRPCSLAVLPPTAE